MLATATTVIDVFRDYTPGGEPGDVSVELDEWGNEINDTENDTDPDPDPVLSGVAASIIEQTQKAPDVSTGNLVAVRAIVGRVTGGTDIRDGDTLRDRRNGARYRVAAWTEPQNPVIRLDRRLELVHIGNPS